MNEGHNVLANKNKPVYILFTNISKVCFVYNRGVICGFNKPSYSGVETKRVPYPSMPMMHWRFFSFGFLFCVPIKTLFYFFIVYLLLIHITLKGDQFCRCKLLKVFNLCKESYLIL